MAAQYAQPFRWHYPDLDDKNFKLHGRGLLILVIVFAVLLFFSLLCLYVRWVCRCPAHWGPRSTGPGTGPPTGPNGNNNPLGLDPRVISSLPVLLHKHGHAAEEGFGCGRQGEDSMCSICLSTFGEGEKAKMLPKCGHTFHPECVDAWLRTRSSCPLCRACIWEVPKIEDVDAMV